MITGPLMGVWLYNFSMLVYQRRVGPYSPRGGTRGFKWRDDRRIFLGLKFSNPWFFWVPKFGKYFLGVPWFFVGTFGGLKKNRYCPGGCIVLRIKYRLTNVFCFCLIVNYGVTLQCTCYTIVCIVPWYPTVYKISTTSIQSVGFTITEIPFCFSELLISFACHKIGMEFFGG